MAAPKEDGDDPPSTPSTPSTFGTSLSGCPQNTSSSTFQLLVGAGASLREVFIPSSPSSLSSDDGGAPTTPTSMAPDSNASVQDAPSDNGSLASFGGSHRILLLGLTTEPPAGDHAHAGSRADVYHDLNLGLPWTPDCPDNLFSDRVEKLVDGVYIPGRSQHRVFEYPPAAATSDGPMMKDSASTRSAELGPALAIKGGPPSCVKTADRKGSPSLAELTHLIRPGPGNGQTHEEVFADWLKTLKAFPLPGLKVILVTFGLGPPLRLPSVAWIRLWEIGQESNIQLEVTESGNLAPKVKDSWPMAFEGSLLEMRSILSDYITRMALPEYRAEFARKAFQQLPMQEALLEEVFNHEPHSSPCVSLMREVTAYVVAAHLSTRVVKPIPAQAQSFKREGCDIQLEGALELLSVQPLSPQIQRALLYMLADMERRILSSLDGLFPTHGPKAWCTGLLALVAIGFGYQSLAMLRYAHECAHPETGGSTDDKKKCPGEHSYKEIECGFDYLIAEFHKLSGRLSKGKAPFNPLGADEDLHKLDNKSQAVVVRLRSIYDLQNDWPTGELKLENSRENGLRLLHRLFSSFLPLQN